MDVDCHSSVAGGVKGNMICLSGGVLSADAGTVGVEAENLFSSFIARAGYELRCCVVILMRELVGLSDRCSLCGNLVAYEAVSRGSSTSHKLGKYVVIYQVRGRFALTKNR